MWHAYKKHYLKKNNSIIVCTNPSYLKINKNHSDSLTENEKIDVSINDTFEIIKEEKEYYLVNKNKIINSFILISLNSKKNLNKYEMQKFKNFYVYCHSCYHNELIIIDDILFYGYIIDPFYPKMDNNSIINKISKINNNKILIENMSKYSGRFMIIKNDICITDTCGQLQTFYYKMNNEFIITSSQKLIKELYPKIKISPDKIKILGYEREFYGYEGLIDNSFLLLPNHYLDINKKEIYRFTLFSNEEKTPNLVKVIKILEGSFEAITHRYGDNLYMGLTSGKDSRCLLAFVNKYKDKIKFFYGFNGDNKELLLAKELEKKLDLNLTKIDLKENKPTKEFIKLYNSNRFTPYYSYIHIKSNLKYYFYKNNQNCMIITGTCAEIFRDFYNAKNIKNYEDLINNINKKFMNNNYLKDFFKKYFNLSKGISEENNIHICDLFYWEQRLGFWNGSNSEEFNIFGNIFIPFNNRILIKELLKFDIDDRKKCNHYNQIITMKGMQDLLKIGFS
jgi:hypothetical protein